MELKMNSKLLAILMSLAMAFTMMPIMGAPVYADDPAPAAPGIALGSDVLSVGSNTSGAATVYMADKTWRVIGYGVSTDEKPQVASSADTMTLISAGNLKTGVQFREDLEALEAIDANHYSKSNLKTEVDTVAGAFSAGEKSGIAARDLASGVYIGSDTDCIAGDEVKGAILWPLSTKEANAMNGDLRRLDGGSGRNWLTDYWWLRSPGDHDGDAAIVRGDGRVLDRKNGIGFDIGVRPAFNFNLKSVIFTSAAVGGKSSGTVGAETLTQIGENASNEWKLTVKDDTHKNFKVDSVTTSDGKNLTIKYSGAKKAGNEYISAIIKNKDDKVKYYGKLALASDGEGAEATVNIDGKMEAGDTLCVFNEQCNGNYKTDFSSPLRTIHRWELVSFGGDEVEGKKPGESGHIKFHLNYKCTCGDPEDYKVEDGAHTTVLERTDEYKIETKTKPTCTEDGTYIYWFQGTGLDGRSYDKGIDTPAPATGHKYGAWKNLDATQHQRVCEHDATHIEKANHSWDAGKVTKAATCTEKGEMTFTCTVEGCEATKTEEIKAKGHTEVVDKAVPATCTEAGLTEGKHCSVCDAVLLKQETVPATGHKWDEGKVTKEATETSEGIKTYTCTACKATKTETIPKLKPSIPKVSGTSLAKATVKKNSLTVGWNKIQGAEGYVVFFALCNHNKKVIKCKKVKTIKGNKTFKWTKSGLKKGTAYKFYVRAYITKNGKKKYVSKTPMFHAYTGNGTKKYTNAKSVTIKNVKKGKLSMKKGKTFKIKAKVNKVNKKKKLMPKSHAPALRYMTTNKKVATVSAGGKITAKGKGTCYIYTFAHNGVSKKVKVTVK